VRRPGLVETYRFTKAECLRKLLKLDRLGLVSLLPGDRMRLNVARDVDWLPGGPIQRFFRKQHITGLATREPAADVGRWALDDRLSRTWLKASR
jgi:hypothetical protein